MFNSGYKKEALADLERANRRYQNAYDETMNQVIKLHDSKMKGKEIIKEVEDFINTLANRSKDFGTIINTIRIKRQRFEEEVDNLELESKKAEKVSGSMAGAGVVAGAGVAAFGPTAAMAIATTFGTASTGTAIATLSGAAATNAALAWLGGGAVLAGGGGMAAGQAFLAMAGPAGWAIGGVALLGGGALANNKNKKVAEKAEQSTREVKKETEKLQEIKVKVGALSKEVGELGYSVVSNLRKIKGYGINNYLEFNEEQLNEIKKLLNFTEALVNKLNEKTE